MFKSSFRGKSTSFGPSLERYNSRRAIPAATYTLSAADLIRVRASTKENKSAVVEWQGQVLSYKSGDVPKVLFSVQGMNIPRTKKLNDGGYDLLSPEVEVYLNPRFCTSA
ncbi:hypothetical protein E4T56_gene7929 [Termitomyces sp. T112]|nr:hypothetical protein E4T56_gene7929 [Termitomyces sp. T112]